MTDRNAAAPAPPPPPPWGYLDPTKVAGATDRSWTSANLTQYMNPLEGLTRSAGPAWDGTYAIPGGSTFQDIYAQQGNFNAGLEYNDGTGEGGNWLPTGKTPEQAEAEYAVAREKWYRDQGLDPSKTVLASGNQFDNPWGNKGKDMVRGYYTLGEDGTTATPYAAQSTYNPSTWVGGGRDFVKNAALLAGGAYLAFGGAGAAAAGGAGATEAGAYTAADLAAADAAAGLPPAGGGGAATLAGGGTGISGGALAGTAAYAPATNAALAESAAGTAGYGASSAGAGGGAGALSSAGGSLMSSLSNALPSTLGGWADLFKTGYGLYSAFNTDDENADMRQGSAEVGAAAQGLAAAQATTLRDETLPMLKERDAAQWGTSRGLVDSNLEDAGLARDRATQAWDQGAKDFEFQDMYRDMARKAQDGSYGDELAGISNADTAQAFDAAEGARQRNAQRLGVNPGSGAYLASMADAYNSRALAQAGGATQARRFARDKAESMVAAAAKGYGNQATSATQAGLATQSSGAAGTANANGITNTGNIQGIANNAYGAINTSLGIAGSAFNRTAAPTAEMVGAVSGAVDRFNGRDPEPKKP